MLTVRKPTSIICYHVQSITNGGYLIEHYNQFPDAFQFIKDVANRLV
jgi:hypothetical protein